MAREHARSRICLLASDAIHAYADAVGLNLCTENAEVVALARDTTLSYAKLRQAIASVWRGAALVVSNPDLAHPGADRAPIPEAGALLQIFRHCIPDVAFSVVGKPSRKMFEIALSRFGGEPSSTVMIDDNPATDEAGAHALGMASILVGRGQAHASIGSLL